MEYIDLLMYLLIFIVGIKIGQIWGALSFYKKIRKYLNDL